MERQLALFRELSETFSFHKSRWIYFEEGHELLPFNKDCPKVAPSHQPDPLYWCPPARPPTLRSDEQFIVGQPTACLACGASGKLRKCLGCKRVAFCNMSCQRAVWPRHKADCKCFRLECVERFRGRAGDDLDHQLLWQERDWLEQSHHQLSTGMKSFVYDAEVPPGDARRAAAGVYDVRSYVV